MRKQDRVPPTCALQRECSNFGLPCPCKGDGEYWEENREPKSKDKLLNWFLAFLVVLVIGLALFDVAAAKGDNPPVLTQDPAYAPLAETASVFSMQPVIVTCSVRGVNPILDYQAWGYVYLNIPEIHMGVYLCDAAAHITDSTYGLSRRAIAALVLIHESYHLRRQWSDRRSEAKVECKAIRHFRVGAQLLGASPTLATQLRSYALAFHWKLASDYPDYNFGACKVPRP